MLVAVVGLLAVTFACSSEKATDGQVVTTTTERAALANFSELGPKPVGVTSLTIPKAAGGEREVMVFYPAAAAGPPEVFRISSLLPDQLRSIIPAELDPELVTRASRDVPGDPTTGPFPVFVFSHGFGGHPMEYQHLLTHVASWGFVVVAPVHDERGLLTLLSPGAAPAVDEGRVLLDALEVAQRASADSTSVLKSLVREGPAVFGGHSAGTRAALAAAVADPERAAGLLQLSGGGVGREGNPPDFPKVPTLFVTGSTDEVIPIEDVRSAFERYAEPKQLISVLDAGHLSFTDLCTIGAESGGLLSLAERLGILDRLDAESRTRVERLAGDGCGDRWITPEQTWRISEHTAVAFLRWRLGTDATPTALTGTVLDAIGGAERTEIVGSLSL